MRIYSVFTFAMAGIFTLAAQAQTPPIHSTSVADFVREREHEERKRVDAKALREQMGAALDTETKVVYIQREVSLFHSDGRAPRFNPSSEGPQNWPPRLENIRRYQASQLGAGPLQEWQAQEIADVLESVDFGTAPEQRVHLVVTTRTSEHVISCKGQRQCGRILRLSTYDKSRAIIGVSFRFGEPVKAHAPRATVATAAKEAGESFTLREMARQKPLLRQSMGRGGGKVTAILSVATMFLTAADLANSSEAPEASCNNGKSQLCNRLNEHAARSKANPAVSTPASGTD